MSLESTHDRGLQLPSFHNRQSLRHQVAHALRAALVAGQMRPGLVYSAPVLAEQLGVSATPVREAMLDLANEGLVEAIRNKGFRVTELSEKDLDDITHIRMLIEVPTVADVARRCEGVIATAVENLRPLAREIELHAVEPDLIQYVEVDRQFHLGLLALAGNAHLVDVVRGLRARSRLYGLEALAERGELRASAAEHEELVNLVLARDAVAAGDLMGRHIGHVRGTWAGSNE